MNARFRSGLRKVQSFNLFTSRAGVFREKLADMRKIREVASLDDLKKEYAQAYGIYATLSLREQQKAQAQMKVFREMIEEYLVVHKRMEVLLQDLSSESISQLREKYDQLHLCLRQLPRGTQQQHYADLVQIRDRLERGL